MRAGAEGVTDEQRQRVFDTLLGDVSMFAPGDAARITLERYTLDQLAKLEPVIDRIVEETVADAYHQAVDAACEAGLMRALCAWHPKLFGTEKVIRQAAPGHEQDEPSHGICEECEEKLGWKRRINGRAA